MVHGLSPVHLVDVTHRLHGEEDDLPIGVTVFGFQCDELAEGTCLKSLIFADHQCELIGGICRGIQHLRCDAAVVLAHEIQDLCSLLGLVLAEILGTEVTRVIQQVCLVSRWGYMVFRGIPSHIHEELYGILHRFEVAHIEDP